MGAAARTTPPRPCQRQTCRRRAAAHPDRLPDRAGQAAKADLRCAEQDHHLRGIFCIAHAGTRHRREGEPRAVELLPARPDKVHHRQETEQEAGKGAGADRPLPEHPACRHHPAQHKKKPDKIRKLVDIQAKVAAGKGIGYERWAKKFNLKRWSQTLILLQEKGLTSEDALHQRIAELQPSTTMHWRWSKTWMPAWSPSRSCAGILWSIGSISLLHRSSRLCGTPPSSRSSIVQSLLCTRPLAPISRPTGSGRCRTSKSWMPKSDPFLGEKQVLHPLQESADRTA